MKRALQKSFFPILVLILLVGSVALASEIMHEKQGKVAATIVYNKGVEGIIATPAGSYINITTGPEGSEPDMNVPHYVSGDAYYLGPTEKANKSTSNTSKFNHGYVKITKIEAKYGWNNTSSSNEPKAST